jgi:NAD(P)-dependent dehydrogenase (short-subunit alcohol dehydrogenase family)
MRLDAMDAARNERIFSVNVFGAMICAREAVKRMSTRYGGRRRGNSQHIVGCGEVWIAGRIR